MGLVESPLRCEAHGGFGRRFGETHRWQHRQGAPNRPHSGRTFARVDRWLPSTRMCSDCGRINDRMALNVRSWVCPCGSHHDRDVNAAINIKAAGQADFNDRGARVGPGPVPAPRGETVTHQNTARVTRGVAGIAAV